MRVALFTDTYLPEVNGVAMTLGRWNDYLRSKQIETIIFAPNNPAINDSQPETKRAFSLPFALYPQCRVAVPNPTVIREQLKQFKPDLIHLATPFNLGVTGAHYAKKYHIPAVASYHTHFDSYLNYYRLQFLHKWIWNYMRWFHQPLARVFVPSRQTAEHLNEHGILKTAIWSRGVDTLAYNPSHRSAVFRERYGIHEKHILLFVGRLAPEKDVHLLADIFNHLSPAIQQNTRFVVVGDGPLYPELKSLRHPKMTFTGFQGGQTLSEMYASADCFVFPSPSETFGNVALEAMASGLPIIGADAGGVQELITDGKDGYLCPAGGAETFAHRIEKLLSGKLRQQMGAAARSTAATRSWSSVFDQLIADYKEVLDEVYTRRKKVG